MSNNEIFYESILPIVWEDYQCIETVMTFCGVTFMEDFGPFKKDQYVSTLQVELLNGMLCEVEANGRAIRECKVKFVIGQYNENERDNVIDIQL